MPSSPKPEAIARALAVAARASTNPESWRTASGPQHFARRVAVGDPQAPIERFFEILWHNRLLTSSGWLESDVHLVSMGDHFDFGSYSERKAAAQSGQQLLSWLAAHPPAQVTLITGNHDLSRVGELVQFSAEEFDAASNAACELYRAAAHDPAAERAFLERYPALPSVELAARDLSTFQPEQRELIRRLLEQRRLRFAAEHEGVLLCHAGITSEHLTAIGLPSTAHGNAAEVSAALNASLDAAVEQWQRGPVRPLDVPHLHRSGSLQSGEGGGILFHRPAHPVDTAHASAPDLFSRRYDPRRIPRGLVQVIGHVRDAKSRSLLGSWVADDAAVDGQLRSLTVRDDRVEYRHGVPQRNAGLTAIVFTDGAMASTPPDRYELLDLNTLQTLT